MSKNKGEGPGPQTPGEYTAANNSPPIVRPENEPQKPSKRNRGGRHRGSKSKENVVHQKAATSGTSIKSSA